MAQRLQRFQTPEATYSTIRASVITAQNKVYSAVNSAVVLAYHEIGEQIYKACGEKRCCDSLYFAGKQQPDFCLQVFHIPSN